MQLVSTYVSTQSTVLCKAVHCLVNITLVLLLGLAGMTMLPVWTMPQMGDLSKQQKRVQPRAELFLLFKG